MNNKFNNVIKKAIPLVILIILVILYFRLQGSNSSNNPELSKEEVVQLLNDNIENVSANLKLEESLEGFDVEDYKVDPELIGDEESNSDITVSNLDDTIAEDGYYYDYESVILYLDTYGKLPSNYISKSKAKKLGWEGGSVEDYLPGGAIGGGRFGNNEGILPEGDGIEYYECDIDTNGKSSRGAKRVVYSNEPKYYYTTDHYENFVRYEVIDGKVVEAE